MALLSFPLLHRLSNTHPRRLIWLYVSVFVICFLTLWRGGEALKQQQIEDLEVETKEQLDQLASVIESAIAKYQHMPTLLASNDRVRIALRDGLPSDINQLNRELEQINRITEASDSYIIDVDGNTIAASNYRSSKSFVGGNFSFRPYFKDALKGKPGRYYALGTTSNIRGYYFSYPVYEGDSIIGVAVVKVDLGQFEKRFSNQSYEFLLLDPDGVVFSSSRTQWLYKVMRELSHNELRRIAESQRYFNRAIVTLPIASHRDFSSRSTIIEMLEELADPPGDSVVERRSYLAMQKPIQLLDFKISVLVPLTIIEEQIALWRAIFAGGITITMLILGLAHLRSRMLQERSDAIEMARHNQAYIREVIQHTQAGLVTLNDQSEIEALNPAVENLLSCSLSGLIGRPLSSLFHVSEKDRVRWVKALQSDFDNTDARLTTVEGELHATDRPSIIVEATICELQLPNRRSHLVTFHDMTERKRYEQEITSARNALELRVKERTSELEESNHLLRQEIGEHKATQQELIQTAKLAVLGQLSAGLNHELNQPLTAIRAFADNGLKFLERERYEQAKGNLHQISQLGLHMSDIIARFKVFARKGSETHSPIDVQSAINGALKIVQPRFKEANIDVRMNASVQLAVLADMVFLEQVLVNLLANAADAILETNMDEKWVEVSVESNEQHVRIKVRDSGKGLSDEALAHLFEPFYTSKASGLGLGLGLSISQRIMESMKGGLSAQNHPEGGAEFCVTLNAFQPE
ncbi:PAS domain-containing sensor histidine kinase [Marinomonas piezotolerans]|uniref:C4-dicarboxylate transport sensor protein DctB n=1 Tax=Marinomonas piezotolerans TaxID=2213058 RepID=A0A370U937_9GAMM|nr:ATP-binding protein [Marinomonas piezotolerans]RDL44281.1 PAS domain-containing sensor histidine kinase [Marinomonas piezotolerans]